MTAIRASILGFLSVFSVHAAGQNVQVRDAVGGVDGAGNEWFLLDGTASFVAGTNGASDVIRDLDIGTFDLEIDTAAGAGWQTLNTYCVELGIDLGLGVNTSGTSTGITYAVAELTSHPDITADESNDIEVLWAHAFADSLTDMVKAAAFQAIVWELTTDDAFDLSAGGFRLDQTDSHTASAATQAQEWFGNILDGTWTSQVALKMLSHDGAQNLIIPESQLSCQVALATVHPMNCAIDARQPTNGMDSILVGIDSIQLGLTCAENPPALEDFVLQTIPADGNPPAISHIEFDDQNLTVTLHLDQSVAAGAWSCVTHVSSGTVMCLGFLPGDVNGNASASPGDILSLIDHLNQVQTPPLEQWQCDIDRSGVCAPADILAEIDLLNGAGSFDPWNFRTLPACPSAGP